MLPGRVLAFGPFCLAVGNKWTLVMGGHSAGQPGRMTRHDGARWPFSTQIN